jgi:D-tyrosyl-tRNA(Tyr) deacylase
MIALLQRVTEARVTVDQRVVGEIGAGALALVCAERGDDEASAGRLVERILGFRMFPDEAGKMNLSVSGAGGGLLLVPQFTLAADTSKGLRPGFSRASPPGDAERLFGYMAKRAEKRLSATQTGRFGAHMRVSLVNDGPVTFWIRVPPHEAPE